MSKGSGGFGIGTIIFLVVAYNFLFDDDDKEIIVDKVKEVAVETKEFIVETRDSETVQEIIQTAKEKLKKDTEEIKDEEEIKETPTPKIISVESKEEEEEKKEEEEEPQTNDFEKL